MKKKQQTNEIRTERNIIVIREYYHNSLYFYNILICFIINKLYVFSDNFVNIIEYDILYFNTFLYQLKYL